MRRLIPLIAAAVALTAPTVPAAAETVGASGSADPALGAISAGAYHYSGPWVGRKSACTWEPFSGDTALDHQQGGPVLTRTRGGLLETAYLRECPGADGVLVWISPADPPTLGRTASKELAKLLPAPRPGAAPPLDASYVTVATWLWTETPWAPRSVTAWVPTVDGGSVWATTTATPVGITFDPGDGSAPVVCDGPGVPWTEADGDEATSDCMVVYRHSSVLAENGSTFTARLSIRWEVAWTSSTGAGGALGPIVGTTAVPVTVREIQAVGTS